mgnify:CR=1 FL=1
MSLIDIIISLTEQNKYVLLFILYLIEGPIAGFLSALIASTGKLDIFLVFTLLVTGEIGADIIYYYIGKNSSETRFNKMISKYEKDGVLKVIKDTLNRSPVKALIFVKSVMFIAVPSILLIGRYQTMKIKKFAIWTTIICFIKDITILSLGYGLGISLETFLNGYNIYKSVGLILAILAIGYIIYTTYKDKIKKSAINLLKNMK